MTVDLKQFVCLSNSRFEVCKLKTIRTSNKNRVSHSLCLVLLQHAPCDDDDDGNCADISVICDACKKYLESETLSYCDECGRLKRQREYCRVVF